MKRALGHLRKVIALLIGLPVLIIGLILIPLPGPGILVSLLGMFILSQEFDWADKHVQRLKKQLQLVVDKSKARNKKK